MSYVTDYRLPCPSPNCSSSDGYHLYSDGHGYCYSCSFYKPHTNDALMNIAEDFTYEYLPFRGISAETMRRYDAKTKIDAEGKPVAIGYPYPTGAIKIRKLDVPKNEAFSILGDTKDIRAAPSLFGRDIFPAGSAKAITITEGQDDALSAYQMLGSKYPVVSIRSASTAKADCSAELKYLDSFEKIYLCFDNDKAGQEAKLAVSTLFDFNKIYDVKLDLKDANEFLMAGKEAEFRNIWYNSRRFLPEEIISTFSEIDEIIDEESSRTIIDFPFETLNDVCDGIKESEIYLITALEGIGKTEIIRAIEYHILKNTDYNIGIIHLEETKKRAIQGYASYELGLPVHLKEAQVTNEQVKNAYRQAVKRDERVHLYAHFGSDDPDVFLDRIRFLINVCSCKFIFLDHIGKVVAGLNEDDERKALDYISDQLDFMVKASGCTLFMISHVNDDGKTRGSRWISKIASVRIDLHRDHLNEDPRVRNTTNVIVSKNRPSAITGPAGKLYFDPIDFTIREPSPVEELLPAR